MPKKVEPKINLEEDSNNQDQQAIHKACELAQRIIDLESRVADKEEELSILKEDLNRLQVEQLPEFMLQMGMKTFSLASGEKVDIVAFCTASIPSESQIEKEKNIDKRMEMELRRSKGLRYLEKNGASSLIKNELEAELGKDSTKRAAAALNALKAMGIEARVSKSVHSRTLSSWVKEQIENGKQVDFELLSVYNGNKAKISFPGQKSSAKTKKATGNTSLF